MAEFEGWEWFYLNDDAENVGPFTTEELTGFYAEGSMTDETYIWAEQCEGWQTIGLYPELLAIVSAGGAPAAPEGYVCGLCNVKKDFMRRCKRCKNEWYCSDNCQKSHWKMHKKTCRRLGGAKAEKEAAAQAAKAEKRAAAKAEKEAAKAEKRAAAKAEKKATKAAEKEAKLLAFVQSKNRLPKLNAESSENILAIFLRDHNKSFLSVELRIKISELQTRALSPPSSTSVLPSTMTTESHNELLKLLEPKEGEKEEQQVSPEEKKDDLLKMLSQTSPQAAIPPSLMSYYEGKNKEHAAGTQKWNVVTEHEGQCTCTFFFLLKVPPHMFTCTLYDMACTMYDVTRTTSIVRCT